MAGYIRYANQGATRNQPLSPQLVQALAYLQPMGVTAEVFSGGQDSSGPNRVGSHRHDHGGAGDIRFYKDGRALSWTNPNDLPIFNDIVAQGKKAGITGFGAGPGYMGEGTMHVGFGSPGVWGAGGKGANAPAWLRAAYNGAPAGAAPAIPDVPDGPKGQEVYATPSQPVDGTMVASTGQPDAGMIDPNDLRGPAKSPLKGFFDALSQYPDAQPARMPQMGDARQSGGGLLELLGNPQALTQLVKKQRGLLG